MNGTLGENNANVQWTFKSRSSRRESDWDCGVLVAAGDAEEEDDDDCNLQPVSKARESVVLNDRLPDEEGGNFGFTFKSGLSSRESDWNCGVLVATGDAEEEDDDDFNLQPVSKARESVVLNDRLPDEEDRNFGFTFKSGLSSRESDWNCGVLVAAGHAEEEDDEDFNLKPVSNVHDPRESVVLNDRLPDEDGGNFEFTFKKDEEEDFNLQPVSKAEANERKPTPETQLDLRSSPEKVEKSSEDKGTVSTFQDSFSSLGDIDPPLFTKPKARSSVLVNGKEYTRSPTSLLSPMQRAKMRVSMRPHTVAAASRQKTNAVTSLNMLALRSLNLDEEDEEENAPPSPKRESKSKTTLEGEDAQLSPKRKSKSKKKLENAPLSPKRKHKSKKTPEGEDVPSSPKRKSKSKKTPEGEDAPLSPKRKSKSKKTPEGVDAPLSPKRKNKSKKTSEGEDASLSSKRKSKSKKTPEGEDASLSSKRKSKSKKTPEGEDASLSPKRKSKSKKTPEGEDASLSPKRKSKSKKSPEGEDASLSPKRKNSGVPAPQLDSPSSLKKLEETSGDNTTVSTHQDSFSSRRDSDPALVTASKSPKRKTDKKSKKKTPKSPKRESGPKSPKRKDKSKKIISPPKRDYTPLSPALDSMSDTRLST